MFRFWFDLTDWSQCVCGFGVCVGCWCCLVCVKCQHLLSLSCDDNRLWSACFHFVYLQQWTRWAVTWHGGPNGTVFVRVWYSLCLCMILSVCVWYSLCPCMILSLSLCGILLSLCDRYPLSLCDTVFKWYCLCPCVVLSLSLWYSLSLCGTVFVLVWYSLCPRVVLPLSLCGTYCLCPCVIPVLVYLVCCLANHHNHFLEVNSQLVRRHLTCVHELPGECCGQFFCITYIKRRVFVSYWWQDQEMYVCTTRSAQLYQWTQQTSSFESSSPCVAMCWLCWFVSLALRTHPLLNVI